MGKKITFWACMIFLGLLACNKEKGASSSGASTASSPAVDTGSTNLYGGSVTGSLALGDGVPASSAAGALIQVENHPEITGTTNENGEFTMSNVTPGSLNVYVLSADGASLSATGSQYGSKIVNIVVKSGETTDVGSQPFDKTGSISGSVGFYENKNGLDLTGSEVFIPGTSFIAKTDSDGKFSLGGLPAGKYDLRMQHTGFAVLDLKGVDVSSGEVNEIGEFLLSLSNGPEGSIAIAETGTFVLGGKSQKLSTSRTVQVALKYDSDAALMRISDEPSFLNKSWQNIASSIDWTFTSDGLKTLYVQYSDLNGLESAPFTDEVYIDTIAPVLDKIVILNGWAQSAKETIYVDITASDGGAGIAEVMFSNVSDQFNQGETWSPYAARVNWSLASGIGSKVVYARVRDYAGRISNVQFDAINLNTVTLIHQTTYTDKIYLLKNQSPFLVNDNVEFSGDLDIEPGVTLYISANKTLTVKGSVNARGTSSSHIIFSQASPVVGACSGMSPPNEGGKLDFSKGLPGSSELSQFSYVDFVLISSIYFNGGTVANSHFDSSNCTGSSALGYLFKTGLDNLTIQNNTFSKWYQALHVSTGIGNTKFTGNTGTVYEGFSQVQAGDQTIISGNTLAFSGGTLFTLSNGSFVTSGNTFTGTIATGLFVNGSGNLVVNDLVLTGFSSVTSGVAYNGTGSLTLDGFSVANCITALTSSDAGPLTVTNSTINGCEKAVHHSGYDRTSTVNVNYSNITVSKAVILANQNNSSSPTKKYTTSLTYNNITCVTATGYCDLYYKDGMNEDPDVLTFNQNNINCSAANNCRGLVLLMPYGGSHNMTLTLNLDNNFWSNKAPQANFSSIVLQDDNVIGTTTDADIKLFKFTADGTDTINLTLIPSSTPFTNLGSSVATAGPQ